MSNPYASGKKSRGICDRCGRAVDYVELKDQVIARKKSGLKVCDSCLDMDHPQLFLPRKLDDPQALRNARPLLDDDGGATPFVYPFVPPIPS